MAGYRDEITDFTHREDVISMGYDAGGPRTVVHDDSSVFADYDAAASYARSIIAPPPNDKCTCRRASG